MHKTHEQIIKCLNTHLDSSYQRTYRTYFAEIRQSFGPWSAQNCKLALIHLKSHYCKEPYSILYSKFMLGPRFTTKILKRGPKMEMNYSFIQQIEEPQEIFFP